MDNDRKVSFSTNSPTDDGHADVEAAKEGILDELDAGEALSGSEVGTEWEAMPIEDKIKFEKKLVRKLDYRLVPWLWLLYMFASIDRTNVGIAKLQGLITDLGMTDTQYNICLTLFYISFAVFEVPSNILLKRLRPHIWFPAIMLSWGIVMTFTGFVTNYQGLLAARFMLGFCEAGLFPGVQFFLSSWYKRREFGLRSAVFFSANALSGAFGGLLGVAIGKMDGVGGKPGWCWIFILEGLLTVIFGATSYFIIVDFPDDATFLSPLEKHIALARLKQDGQASHRYEPFKWHSFFAAYRDWKTYTAMLMTMGIGGAAHSFSLFLPSIINALGYTDTQAQLLSVPPYIVGFITILFVGFTADRVGRRGIFNLCFGSVAVAGLIILLVSREPHLSYSGTFLVAFGLYPCLPNTITWIANNVEGVYKRGVVIATVISWGNINGVMSCNVYRTVDAPWYQLGNAVVLGYVSVGLVIGSALNLIFLSIGNKIRANASPERRRKSMSHLTPEERIGFTDFHPDFKYTL